MYHSQANDGVSVVFDFAAPNPFHSSRTNGNGRSSSMPSDKPKFSLSFSDNSNSNRTPLQEDIDAARKYARCHNTDLRLNR
jgi:hypothetical protein